LSQHCFNRVGAFGVAILNPLKPPTCGNQVYSLVIDKSLKAFNTTHQRDFFMIKFEISI